ncbi:MAG: histidine phosphatase family protein [Anaerolineae bacterium]|nr:histidine phosphatase family protein [Anaerolineae bacterium]
MRYLEIRRHSMRVKPGQHLSQEGVDLARRIGSEIGPFEFVITSSLHRAYETAIAMGFAVNDQLEELSYLGHGIEAEVAWDAGFAAFAAAYRQAGVTTAFVAQQAGLWRMMAEPITDGGSALVITHGGIVEAGAVGCLPNVDHAAWGPGVSYCEGVRLHFDGENFVDVDILRIPS